jgi:hypothetical protein
MAARRGYFALLGSLAAFLLGSVALSSISTAVSSRSSKVFFGTYHDVSFVLPTATTRRSALEAVGATPAAPGWHPRRYESGGGGGRGGGGHGGGGGEEDVNKEKEETEERDEGVGATTEEKVNANANSANTPAEAAVKRSQLRSLTASELATLTRLDPAAFAAVPPGVGAGWDPALKNPCWSDPGSGHARCLPYYYVVGRDGALVTTLPCSLRTVQLMAGSIACPCNQSDTRACQPYSSARGRAAVGFACHFSLTVILFVKTPRSN